MAVMKALFDSNIIIDALNGHRKAKSEIAAWPDRAICVISFVEVMAGVLAGKEKVTRDFLLGFKMIDVDSDVAEYAVSIQAERRLSLADAIIVATAQATGRTLITRDTKLQNEFDDPVVFVPYQFG
jgi:predicted nucleic acid-binding protein